MPELQQTLPADALCVSYTPKEEDLIRLMEHLWTQTAGGQARLRWLTRIMTVALGGAFAFLFVVAELYKSRYAITYLAGIVLLPAIFYWADTRKLGGMSFHRPGWRRAVKRMDKRRFETPLTACASDSGIAFSGSLGDADFRWHFISEINRDDDYIYVIYPELSGSPIPIGAFASGSDADAFYEFAREQCERARTVEKA
jgi:hypothetical protein